MLEQTFKVVLLCQETDSEDYTTYVFMLKDQAEITRLGFKYIMCTKWPNWNHRTIVNGEAGFLSVTLIEAGVDKWFNGTDFVPYKYSNIQFNRFIHEQPKMNCEIIL